MEAAQTATAPAGAATKSLLDLKSFSLDLGFEGSFDRRDTSYRTGDPLRRSAQLSFALPTYHETDRDRRLEETVGVRGAGALFDEKIALFDVAARYGLTQEWFRQTRPGPDLRQESHGDLLNYDLNLSLLPRGTLSANVYASRLDSRVPRAFLPSLDRTLERYGADVFINDARFPMRFSFEHRWDELTSRTRALNDDEQRGDDQFRYEGTWQISPNQSLRLEYEYADRTERYSGTRTRFDTTRNYVTLDHTLRFGAGGKSSWETLARLQDESGDLARDTAEASTRLRLQHTDSVASNFAAQFLRESFAELNTRSWRGEAGLTHQLGQTLTSSVQLYGLRQQADDAGRDFASHYHADSTEWGAVASTAFSRENTLGRFSANLSYNHAATDTQSGRQRGVVIAESVTFRDPLPAYLVHTDVDRMTVIVTDAERTRTYLPIRDYAVVALGRYTALRRVPTGQIADRQTVLVTYTYEVARDYDISRDRIDLRLQQEFKCGLTPYYAASVQDEDLDRSGPLSFRARNVNRQRVGATYRQKRWSAGLEYEYNDDAIDPYQAGHANGDVVLWQTARQQLDGKLTASRFWFEGADELPRRNTTLLDLGASYRYLLRQDLEATASALYRFEDDSLYGDTHGVDLTAALDWRIGYFALRCEAEYKLLDLPGSRDGAFSFWIKLKRDIPLIERGAQ
jgi:hypothetical protein